MISEYCAAAGLDATGVTGVTRLIENGVVNTHVPSVPIPPVPLSVMVTMMLAVNVPVGSVLGSARTSRVIPSGGSAHISGRTLSQGRSVVAVQNRFWPAWPGMKTCWTTTSVEPAGTFVLGFGAWGSATGMMTIRTAGELKPDAVLQAVNARTR